MEAIQRQAEEAMQNFDPAQLNPESGENIISLSHSIMEYSLLKKLLHRRAALSKLETALALVDGWADEVTLAAGDRLPALDINFARFIDVNAQPMHHHNNSSNHFLGLQVSPKLRARSERLLAEGARRLKILLHAIKSGAEFCQVPKSCLILRSS